MCLRHNDWSCLRTARRIVPDVGQPRDQRSKQHFRVADLAVERADVGVQKLRIQFGHVPADDISHGVDLAVAPADGFDRSGVVGDLGLLDSIEVLSCIDFAGGSGRIPNGSWDCHSQYSRYCVSNSFRSSLLQSAEFAKLHLAT